MSPAEQYQFYQAACAAQEAMNSFSTRPPYEDGAFFAQTQSQPAWDEDPYAQEAAQAQPAYQAPPQQNQQSYAGYQTPPVNPQPQPSQQETENARGFLGDFVEYLRSGAFKQAVNTNSQRYNVPPKQLAQNFLERCLATIGDVLGIVIATAGNAVHTLIEVLSNLAHGAANIIVNVANGIMRCFTLNKTCVQ